MSGGQQQRCAIARALINHPKILFADEPTGSLNSSSGKEILELLYSMSRTGQDILIVTHDIKAALMADRILYLKDGKITAAWLFRFRISYFIIMRMPILPPLPLLAHFPMWFVYPFRLYMPEHRK